MGLNFYDYDGQNSLPPNISAGSAVYESLAMLEGKIIVTPYLFYGLQYPLLKIVRLYVKRKGYHKSQNHSKIKCYIFGQKNALFFASFQIYVANLIILLRSRSCASKIRARKSFESSLLIHIRIHHRVTRVELLIVISHIN